MVSRPKKEEKRRLADNHLSETPDSPHSEVAGSGSSAIELTVRRENLAASSKVIDIGKKVQLT